ncbi:MAG: DUF4115 domain-containing protein [Candidatus Omnitrophica bacterium]|nr:DUF4115 domain-containing protein [Candidatus Omnitrophota bacterium]
MNIQTAGVRLKQLRIERGISLEEVQKRTKIHLNVLRAIEGDSLTDLSPIYLRSFIKIYCNYLNVESKDYLGPSAQQPQSQAVLNSKVGRPVGQRAESLRSFVKDTAVKINSLRPPKRFNKLIFFIVLAILIFSVAAKLIQLKPASQPKNLRPENSVLTSANVKSKQKIRDSKNKAGVLTDNTSAPKMRKAITSGFVLGIVTKDKCWVSLKVDGHTVFRGILPKARFETWKAKDKLELALGDAAAVELQVNDQRFPNLGRKGQSLRILINKDGLKINK